WLQGTPRLPHHRRPCRGRWRRPSRSSARGLRDWFSRRGHALRDGILERQSLTLSPRARRLPWIQSFAAGPSLLFAQQPSQVGAGRPLVRFRGARQPRRFEGIAVAAYDLRKIVQLQHNPGEVVSLLEDSDRFQEAPARQREIVELESNQPRGVQGPA